MGVLNLNCLYPLQLETLLNGSTELVYYSLRPCWMGVLTLYCLWPLWLETPLNGSTEHALFITLTIRDLTEGEYRLDLHSAGVPGATWGEWNWCTSCRPAHPMAAQAGSLPRPAGQHSAGGRTGLEEDGNSQPTLSDHSGWWVTVSSGYTYCWLLWRGCLDCWLCDA